MQVARSVAARRGVAAVAAPISPDRRPGQLHTSLRIAVPSERGSELDPNQVTIECYWTLGFRALCEQVHFSPVGLGSPSNDYAEQVVEEQQPAVGSPQAVHEAARLSSLAESLSERLSAANSFATQSARIRRYKASSELLHLPCMCSAPVVCIVEPPEGSCAIGGWLEQHSLAQYCDTLVEEGFNTLESLSSLTDEVAHIGTNRCFHVLRWWQDMRELGIRMAHRKALAKLLPQLQGEETAAAASVSRGPAASSQPVSQQDSLVGDPTVAAIQQQIEPVGAPKSQLRQQVGTQEALEPTVNAASSSASSSAAAKLVSTLAELGCVAGVDALMV